MGSSVSFQYQPFSEERQTRLLRIPPKSTQNSQRAIKYTLLHASLDSNPEYTALSYSWGNRNPPSYITVNGQSCKITGNLADGLLQLQRDEEEVTVWADALCINQSDAAEKTAQVKLMREIYQNARNVFIWLGPSDNVSDSAMQEIRKLGAQLLDMGVEELRIEDMSGWELDAQDMSRATVIKRRMLNLADQHIASLVEGKPELWWAMSDIGKRLWWRRIWCIQELALAKVATFRCGQEEVDSAAYWAVAIYVQIFNARAMQYASKNTTTEDQSLFWKLNWLTEKLTEAVPSQSLGIRRKFTIGHGFSLRNLLSMTNIQDSFTERMQASDERDRVYALLGMANDDAAREIVPDYALSTEDAFTEIAIVLLKHGHDDVLSLCRIRKECRNLPSWVPDWSATIQKPWSVWQEERAFEPSKTGRISIGATPVGMSHQLALQGVFVDEITEVGPKWALVNDKFDYPAALAVFNTIDKFLSQSTKYNEDERREALWRIPVGDTAIQDLTSQVVRAPADSIMKDGYRIVKMFTNGTDAPDALEEASAHRVASAHYQCQMGRMHNSRPFISASGYVGLCPMEAEIGDRIVIFLGARTPYVIRKVDETAFWKRMWDQIVLLSGTNTSHNAATADAAQLWQLTGEAHVHGIMDGEFMADNPSVEDITLI